MKELVLQKEVETGTNQAFIEFLEFERGAYQISIVNESSILWNDTFIKQ